MRRPALYATALVAAGLIGCGLYRRMRWSGYYAASRLANARRRNVLALRPKITLEHLAVLASPRQAARHAINARFRPERAGVA